jgi:hypothetical protein
MDAETVGTREAGASAGTRRPYGRVEPNNQATSPQASFPGEEDTADSTGTMPPVSNVDPNG